MFSPESSNLQDLDLAGLADGLSKPPPFGVSPSLMLMNSVGNAFLCECMRINANVRDYAIFYWPFCSSRIESHEAVRQDVCCTGTGKPAPVQHRPLLTYGSTASCSARLTVAAATKEPRAPNGVISHSCWYGPFSIYLCAISCLFLLVAACMMNMQ